MPILWKINFHNIISWCFVLNQHNLKAHRGYIRPSHNNNVYCNPLIHHLHISIHLSIELFKNESKKNEPDCFPSLKENIFNYKDKKIRASFVKDSHIDASSRTWRKKFQKFIFLTATTIYHYTLWIYIFFIVTSATWVNI